MNKSQLLVKLACGVGYLLFAGFSAYFTASSLSLNLLNGTNLWLVFALALVVAILAGWCLTNAIGEAKKRIGASKSKFWLSLLGFLVFWGFSFVTNVHYFFVEKHGYEILAKELSSAKNYIVENTEQNNKSIEDQKNAAKIALENIIDTNQRTFAREIQNTMDGHYGFGDACISILKSTEVSLRKDAEMYGDTIQYTIFDESRDSGDKGVTQRSRIGELREKYTNRMQEWKTRKLAVIENFYERQKNQNTELLELLDPIEDLEKRHLPAVLKDGSINAYYKYYDQQNGRVIAKMPKAYSDGCVVMKDGKLDNFNVYPSHRMFDTMSVWSDILSGRLLGMTMLQWIIIALIFDIVSFILFALFRRDND